MLGSDIGKLCQEKNISATVLDLPECDITNDDHLQAAIDQAYCIINCAAYTNVDLAESERERAIAVNAQAVANLARLAERNDVYVVHVSTDFVFDGSKQEAYNECDEANPINAYGASKLAGEKLFIESGCAGCIVRVQWTYGLGASNFVTKIISLSQNTKELKVVDDQIGNPTWTADAARAILELINKRAQGLYHFADQGKISRYEMANFVMDSLGIDAEIEPCKSEEFKSPAKRPLNSTFNCEKIGKLLSEPIEGWQQSLEKFLEQLMQKGNI